MMFWEILTDRYKRANIWLLAFRELQSRIVGTYLGLGHYLLLPVFLLLVYSFVFSVVFSIRWGAADAGFGNFALRLFIGLIAFQFFSEVVNRAPGLVLENAMYVKKVVFPLETLVPITVVVSLFSASITFAVFVGAYMIAYGLPPLTIVWLIALWPPLILITSGLGWGLASLGVFLRDLKQLVTILTSALIFLTPVFYPISIVPPPYNLVMLFNPLSWIIESMRAASFDSRSPDFLILLGFYIGSFAFAQFGYWGFMRTRRTFADVI